MRYFLNESGSISQFFFRNNSMKNLLFTLGLSLLPLAGMAQTNSGAQLPNADFQQFEDDATNTIGKRPVGWSASNVNQMLKKQLVYDASASGEGVKMQNDFVGMFSMGANAPAYVTLGKTWNYVKGMDPSTGDGGTYGGISFTYMPDAVKISYKRVMGTQKPKEEAKFIVYSWKGQTSSTGKWSGEMIDREQDILGKTPADVVVTKSPDFALVSQAEYSVPAGTLSEFKTVEIPLKYEEGQTAPEKINVILSSADYYTRANIGKGNVLYVNNIQMVYHHALHSFTYNGVVYNVTPGVTEFDLTGETYEASLFSCEKEGVGATVNTTYHETDGVLTVEVLGNDYEVNPDSRSVYTIRFAQPVAAATLTSVQIGGVNLEGFSSAQTEYTLPYPYFTGIVIEGTPAQDCRLLTVKEGAWFDGQTAFFDSEAQTVTLKVANAKDEVTDYVFRFTPAVEGAESGEYNGAFNLVLVTADDQTSRGPLVSNEKISLTRNADGTVNLHLKNFNFMGGIVGDIFVPHAQMDGNQLTGNCKIRLTAFNEDGTVNTGALGWTLGVLPLDVKVTLYPEAGKGILDAAIDIDMSQTVMGFMFKRIHVNLLPFLIEPSEVKTAEGGFGLNYYDFMKVKGYVTKETTRYLQVNNSYVNDRNVQVDNPMSYLDLSEAVLAKDVTYEDLMQGAPSVNNTLLYVADGVTLEGENIVKGGIVQNFVLTDGATFFAPKEFTAESVTYLREFDATAGVKESVILPFAVPAESLNGHLYEFKVVKDGSALFEELHSGLKAYTPYMVDASVPSLFEELTAVKVPATSGDVFEQTQGEYKHSGVLAATKLASSVENTFYIYKDGAFVKAEDEVLAPFRTALSTMLTESPAQLKAEFKEIETGLDSVEADCAAVVDVYTLEGRLVRRQVEAGKALQGLEKGIYIVGGKKVLVK